MMLDEYISRYGEGFDFEFSRRVTREVSGVRISLDVMVYDDSVNRRQKAHVLMERDGLKYECDLVDIHNWDDCFHPVTIKGKEYLCFRKTLYGFTLLDAQTLTEECDYFPAKVAEGEESFVIAEAKSFGELLVFDGCYWASPCACFVYEHGQKRYLNLSGECGIVYDEESRLDGGKLVLCGLDDKEVSVEVSLTETEICRLLEEKGSSEF